MLLCVEIAGDFGGQAPTLACWETMLDSLDAVSPLVDDVRPGLAFLDMHGIAGDESTWMAQTRAVLARCDHAFRLGVGTNKIAARAAAQIAGDGMCKPGAEREMLAPLPLALLEIDPETIERLALLGIERLGDLAALPHGPFVRRFGGAAAAWHELARGIDRRPFVPRAHAIAIEASIFGQGRASDEAQVFFALRMLLSRICADLQRCGRRTGALRLSIELEDSAMSTFDMPLASPTAHERTIFDIVRAKLEGATFESAIVGLRLQAQQLEEGGEAQPLFAADDFDAQRVAVTIARLEAALGQRVTRAQTRAGNVLEERFVYEPFQAPQKTMFEQPRNPSEPTPQLRLLEIREIAVELRNGEPAFVNRTPVRQCTGPWRIAERPFTASPVVRDEYDVVLEDGTVARIYHQNARWYLRGVYE